MQEVIRFKPLALNQPALPNDPGKVKALKWVRGLIWAYFILLIFEGTLRKWILPQYSDVLLVVRDPVVIAIYLLAIKARVFPRNGYMLSLGIIAFLSWLVSLVVMEPYLSLKSLILVTGFGFRCNFLHLPLIFVIGKVWDHDDLLKLGKWILIGSLPMSLLLAIQFNSAPDAFINRTAGAWRNAPDRFDWRQDPAARHVFVCLGCCFLRGAFHRLSGLWRIDARGISQLDSLQRGFCADGGDWCFGQPLGPAGRGDGDRYAAGSNCR